jgi:hypothetical protein
LEDEQRGDAAGSQATGPDVTDHEQEHEHDYEVSFRSK